MKKKNITSLISYKLICNDDSDLLRVFFLFLIKIAFTFGSIKRKRWVKRAFSFYRRKYNLINVYSLNNANYQSVLVYLNGIQLLNVRDYINDGSTITLSSTLSININDVLTIYEYASTQGCMIPATPTKLGLYPKFTPEIVLDDSYIGQSQNVIVGHDGSKTIAFNDFRDQVLLEFETRIYNNIQVNYDTTTGFNTIEPGAFRNTDYSIDEWTQLLSSTFLSWSGSNNIDIFTNTTTLQNDPFSFNYSQAYDVLFNQQVPGYWRGIYKYFYDTDTPHLTPWQMLGFSQKPTWWELRYGVAPYTAGNMVLWKDLELGLIYIDGKNSYINPSYARPGLSSIIPVDEHGILLPPISVLIQNWNEQTAGLDWRVGDQAPPETAWRRSSDYPFAVQIAWALARPAEYCNLSLNTQDRVRIAGLNQIINRVTGNRQINLLISDSNQYIPGSNVWIRDRLADLSLDITENFSEIFSNYKLNLLYKSSGFTNKNYVQVVADQASPNSKNVGIIIPSENYSITMTKSAPVSSLSYSAIVIVKGSGGFKVYGFDTAKPYFTIIPRQYNTLHSHIVKISNSTATIYDDDANSIQVLPYGTFFSTPQQTVDFIVSYGKFLSAQGFTFTSIDAEAGLITDWEFSVREFLYWLEQGWDNSTILSLTPAGYQLNFDSGFGVVDDLTSNFMASRVIDSDGNSLQSTDYAIYRYDTQFQLKLRDITKGIHLVDINVVLYEHSIIFDNTTVFNDVIYEPALGNRQYRMKITGYKTRNWNGSMYAPGFMVNSGSIEQWIPNTDYRKGDIVLHKNLYYVAKTFIPGTPKFQFSSWYTTDGKLLNQTLIPNMAFNAKQFENFYDIDTFDVNSSADMAARNSTGFVPREYLDEIGLDTISQHKFYLGMIKEKGTQAAINAFLRAELPYLDNNIEVNEQWAIRLGNYGGTDQTFNVELSLTNAQQLNGAYVFELINSDESYSDLWNSVKPKDLLIKPANYNKDIFYSGQNSKQIIATTGPVIIDEVAATVFDIIKINNISGYANYMGEGSRIWIGSDRNNNWNVFRISTLARPKINIINATVIKNEIEFQTDAPHGLTSTDLIMVKKGSIINKTIDLSGFYRVNSVSDKTFRVPIYPKGPSGQGSMQAELYVLKTMRFSDRKQMAEGMPAAGWRENDQTWIYTDNTNYAVLKNYKNWIENQSLTPVYSYESDSFGRSIDIKASQDIMVVGAPAKNTTGSVYVYHQEPSATWAVVDNIYPDDQHALKFGYSLKYNNLDSVVIGAPDSNNSTGLAYIAVTNNNLVSINQVININGLSNGAAFGQAVATSKNGQYVAISAPNANQVYVFQLTNIANDTVSSVLGGQDYLLAPLSAQQPGITELDIKVKFNGKLLVPYLDYTFGTRVIDTYPTNYVVSLVGITPGQTDVLEITYETYYKLVDVLNNGADQGNFGYSLSFASDASQLVIGSPTTSTVISGMTYTSIGTVYVYDNSQSLTSYNLLETINAPDLQNNLRFGHEVVICPNTCSIYVGAIGYNSLSNSNGVVYRYINTGRLYGVIVGTNPSVLSGINTLSVNSIC